MKMRMHAHVTRWLLVGIGVLALHGGTALASAPASADPRAAVQPSAPAGDTFLDNFNGPSLDGGWTWVRQDNTAWSLSERPGYLRIHTQAGTLDDAATANNSLRRAAPGSDYEVSTRVELNVTQDFHEAALMLYTGDSNFIKISRIYKAEEGGSIFLLRREVAGAGVGSFFSAPIATGVAEMRLRFVAPWVSGAYKDANGNWVELGTYNVGPLNTYTYVALAAHHGFPDVTPNSIVADFDYFRIATASALLLPLMLR
jgi:beta-xylosidase